jgi:arginase
VHTLQDFLRRVAGAALYLHVDMDVVDESELRGNAYAAPEGLSVETLIGLISTAAGEGRLAAAAVTALDPACDPDRAWSVAQRVVRALADAPARPPDPDATAT